MRTQFRTQFSADIKNKDVFRVFLSHDCSVLEFRSTCEMFNLKLMRKKIGVYKNKENLVDGEIYFFRRKNMKSYLMSFFIEGPLILII